MSKRFFRVAACRNCRRLEWTDDESESTDILRSTDPDLGTGQARDVGLNRYHRAARGSGSLVPSKVLIKRLGGSRRATRQDGHVRCSLPHARQRELVDRPHRLSEILVMKDREHASRPTRFCVGESTGAGGGSERPRGRAATPDVQDALAVARDGPQENLAVSASRLMVRRTHRVSPERGRREFDASQAGALANAAQIAGISNAHQCDRP